MKRFSLLCAALVGFAGPLCAQQIGDAGIPSAPANGFFDKEGVLRADSGMKERIIGQIRDLRERHGYRLYLNIENTLISTTPADYAARLQQEWLPEGGGLVIVFESETGRMGFGRSLAASESLVENESGVPAYEIVATVSKAMEQAKGADTAKDYLATLMNGISTGLNGYFERKNAPVDGGRSLKLGLVAIGFLALLTLCGMGLRWLMGKAGKRQPQKRIFPPAEVPERLSAPYGGGGGGYGSFGNGGS